MRSEREAGVAREHLAVDRQEVPAPCPGDEHHAVVVENVVDVAGVAGGGAFVGVGVEHPEPRHRAEFDRLAVHYTVEPKA